MTTDQHQDERVPASVSEAGIAALAGYKFPEVALSPLDRLLWPFSCFRRLKRDLALAIGEQTEFERITRIERSLGRITLHRVSSARRAETSTLVGCALSLLCCSYLRSANVEAAGQTLGRLEEHDRANVDLGLLRSAIVASLVKAKAGARELSPFLSAIFADVQASRLHQSRLVLDALSLVYSTGGAEACKKILVAGCEQFKTTAFHAAVMSVCDCPLDFRNADEAASWDERIVPEDVGFARAMERDANLIKVRAAEWREDLRAMMGFASRARQLDEESLEARYWLTRVKLHDSGHLPDEIEVTQFQPVDPRWARILSLSKLHRRSDLAAAKDALHIYTAAYGHLDVQERRLFLDLSRRALQPRLDRPRDEIAACGELSRQIRLLTGALGWCTVNIAINLLICRHEYVAALEELQRAECHAEELGRPLVEIAGILSARSLSSPSSLSSLDAIRNVILCLVARDQDCSPAHLGHLRAALEASVDDQWMTLVPPLGQTTQGLVRVLTAMTEQRPALDALTHQAKDATLPIWLRWLSLRLLLIRCGPTNELGSELLEANTPLPLTIALVTWVGSFAASSVGNGFRSELPTTQDGDLLAKMLGLFASSEATQARYATSKEPTFDETALSTLIPRLNAGLNLNAAIVGDLQYAISCQRVRGFLREGEVKRAGHTVEQLLAELRVSPWVTRSWWEPLFGYWRAVAHATIGNYPDASAGFAALIDGPKSEEAKGQLALLNLAASRLDEASAWLSEMEPRFPGVLYAQALLAWRLGRVEHATSLLASFDSRFGGASPSYRQACLRLLASIEERTGRTRKALSALRLALTRDAADATAAFRLSRIVAQDIFQEYGAYGASKRITLWTRRISAMQASARHTDRKVRHLSVFNLVEAQGDQLLAEANSMRAADPAWKQLVVERLLREDLAEHAAVLLRSTLLPLGNQNGSPTPLDETRFVLLSWQFLRHAWQLVCTSDSHRAPDSPAVCSGRALFPDLVISEVRVAADLVAILRSIGAVAETFIARGSTRGTTLAALRAAVGIAEKISSDQELDSESADGEIDELRPVYAIHSLCYVPEPRTAPNFAKDALDLAQSVDIRLTQNQRRLARAIAKWALSDDEVLTDFAALENVIDELPMAPEDLWLAKAAVLFNQGRFKSIVDDGTMPTAIADLSNRDGCLLIANSYARIALEEWRKQNTRAVLQHVKRAASTLASFPQNM